MTADTHAMIPATGHEPLEHSPVGALSHDARGGISNPILGMILFICSEVMFFSGLFAAYFSVRAQSPSWPPVTARDSSNCTCAICRERAAEAP